MGLECVANLVKFPSSYQWTSGCQHFLSSLATYSEATRSLTHPAGLSGKFLERLNFRTSLGGQLSELEKEVVPRPPWRLCFLVFKVFHQMIRLCLAQCGVPPQSGYPCLRIWQAL